MGVGADLVRADTWRGFRELVMRWGGDPDAILRQAGVDPEAIRNPDTYLPYTAMMRSFEIAAERVGRADFGLTIGQVQGEGVLGPVSVAAQNCETARAGIECAARFASFHNRALKLAIDPMPGRDDDLVWQDVLLPDLPPHVQQTERMISYQHKTLSRMAGESYAPVEVWFQHARKSPLDVYVGVFGVAPMFGKPKNGIVVARATLDAPQPGRSAHLRRTAMQYLESLSAGASVSERVRAALQAMLRAGSGAQSEVAEALSLHERTLQRRLKEEGVSFEDVRDGVRREMAEGLLAQRDIPISHIAEMLGYAESSVFTRSCRRWFGEPPRGVRKRLVGADARA
jgi:AraC-like DNA-binding protein